MGLGKDTIRVLVAVAGMDVSCDLTVWMPASLSMNGTRISGGALEARGPMLLDSQKSVLRL